MCLWILIQLVCTYLFALHILLLFTDGSPSDVAPKRIRKYALRPDEDGTLVDERVTRQHNREATRKIKTPSDVKKKGKGKRINYKEDMDGIDYSALRQLDWFEDEERNEGVENGNFWCMKQNHVYDDIYQTFEHHVRPMHPINMQLLRSKKKFSEAVEVTDTSPTYI